MFLLDVELPVTESDLHKQNLKLNFRCGECHYGVIWIVSQLFAYDVVLLVSLTHQ